MDTKKTRINITVEPYLDDLIEEISVKESISKSNVVSNLVKEALELREDISLTEIGEERLNTFKKSDAITHEEVW